MSDTFESLTAELRDYCAAKNLPPMSADELLCEVSAVMAGEPSAFIAAPEHGTRAGILQDAETWLGQFCQRWEEMESADEALRQWREAGRDVSDLRDEPEVTQIYPEDRPEPVAGRIYDPGFIECASDGQFCVIVGNQEFHGSQAEAEAWLWTNYAKAERGHR